MDDALPTELAADLDGAYERLVIAHQDRLFSIALRLLGDPRDAEEVAQDALVRAYRALATYDAVRIRSLALRPWLAAIVVNLSRNRGRRRKLATVRLDVPSALDATPLTARLAAPDTSGSPHAAALRRESAHDWAALLATLPPRLRVPVVLRHVDGLSYAEMATALGRPEGTLKAQVHRGLARLRAAAESSSLPDLEVMTA